MNAVRCIVIASVSIITVKTMKRIPLNLFYRTRPDEKFYSEDITETDNQNRKTLDIDDMDSQTTGHNGMNSYKISKADLKFTDFILEAAKLLKTYENKVLEEAFVAIDYAIWENMYNGCKSDELGEFRRYVSEKLVSLKDASADMLRQYLDNVINIIKNEDYGDIAHTVDFVNSLFIGENDKFIEVLLALVHKRISAGVDLSDIFKHALKYLVFDHYCGLDTVVRHDLIQMIKHYWRQVDSPSLNTRYINGLSLATPFMHDKRNVEVYKKHRFKTVTGGPLPDPKRNTELDVEYSDEEASRAVMRAGSAERTDTQQNHLLSTEKWDSDETNVISSESESTKDDLTTTIKSTPSKIDENFGRENLNNTIDRLIKIGNIAKEINEMVALDNKILRHGPNIVSLNTLLGMDLLGIMNGGMLTTPQTINEMDGKKDILISMQAKYQE